MTLAQCAYASNTNSSTALMWGICWSASDQEKAFSPYFAATAASCGVLNADYKFEGLTELECPLALF